MLFRAFRLLSFFGLVGLLSCSTHDSRRLQIDADVPEEERARIASAIDAWNAVTFDDHKLFIAGPEEAREDVTRISVTDDLPVGLQGRECTWEGFECAEADWVRIRKGLPPDRELAVAQHEFGHVLMMKHTPASAVAVMNPIGQISPVVTPADLLVCSAADACGSVVISTKP